LLGAVANAAIILRSIHYKTPPFRVVVKVFVARLGGTNTLQVQLMNGAKSSAGTREAFTTFCIRLSIRSLVKRTVHRRGFRQHAGDALRQAAEATFGEEINIRPRI